MSLPQSFKPAQELRPAIDECLGRQDWPYACRLLQDLWRQQATPATAGYIVSRYERLRPYLSLVPCRLALLRSFTVEPVLPLLRAAAFTAGIDLQVQTGEFNAYAQEILHTGSKIYAFAPDVSILAVQTRDIAPELWEGYAGLSAAEVNSVIHRVVTDFETWVRTFRSHSRSSLVLHTLETPLLPSKGLLDYQNGSSQVAAILGINQQLRQIASEHPGVYLLDYDATIARYGRARWHDERKWLTMRMPFAAENLINMAQEWLRFLHPLAGKTCKVLATDLDNTLWGGVVGEDGPDKIQLGQEYPGAAYRDLQRALLDLHRRGILLAICSKNNPADATAILECHPEMLLRPGHFAALRMNWNDKPENLRQIAVELNVGLDSVAFLDDNPVEREFIRAELPEVTVIDVPRDPTDYARALRDHPVFERLALSAEDAERGRYYAEQRNRQKARQSAHSVEDFYRSLAQEVEISNVLPETLGRVAQLTQKTNQFNLTTRRYTEQEMSNIANTPGYDVYAVRVRDRLGDNGIAGVMITRRDGEFCNLDAFLLSCRVIGRTIETAMLSFLIEKSRREGIRLLQGWFMLTAKNAPAQDFYKTHGFFPVQSDDSRTLWSISIEQAQVTCPSWIRLVSREECLAC